MTGQHLFRSPSSLLGPVDDWLNTERPSVEQAVERLHEVRQVADQAGLAEAHIVAYVREVLDLDDLAADPALLREDAAEADE
jgi:hypothetical protein